MMTSGAGQRGRRRVVGILVALTLLLGGCVSPARPREPATEQRPLQGEYLASFHVPYAGPIRCYLTVESSESGIKANTRPGAALAMLEGVERLLGTLAAPVIFPRGMILTWNSTMPADGKVGEGTIGVGASSALRVKTRMHSPRAPVELVYKDGRVVALMTLEPGAPGTPAVSDYPALAARAAEAVRADLFDPALASSSQMSEYLSDLATVASKSRDDAEFLFGSYLAARRHLRIGTPLFYRLEGERESARLWEGREQEAEPFKVTADDGGIVTLRLDVLARVEEVDQAMQAALAASPKGLMIDLRTCVGPTLASARVASWLCSTPVEMGTYAGPAARDQVAPGAGVGLDLGRGFHAERLADGLKRDSLLRLRAQPEGGAYTGPVVLLTSRRTSSTAEALVAALRSAGRVEVAGERTAGRPFLSREIDIGHGWVLRLPTHDFWICNGSRVPATGWNPDHACGKDAAPEHARKRLRELLRLPLAAAPVRSEDPQRAH
ncbi:MAG: hypothetical protein DYG92_07450 [Leptolyngbya sp. PLA1]|nr:hypothetical protein [Leptolyngbya sp. PLA1]